MILVVSTREPEVDLNLFIKPFRREAWIGIGACISAILGLAVLPNFMLSNYFSTQGFRLFVTTGWLFFVLLQIYYSGTLTMFFTSEAPLQFETMHDVIQAYPHWKLLHQRGTEYYIMKEVAVGKTQPF